ncbi:MAG TPA: archaemetzincin [Planctomycetota bacterium]|nr:archaemetzincin [Planctomycetota bacterium]
MTRLVLCALMLVLISCASAYYFTARADDVLPKNDPAAAKLYADANKLRPLHTPLGKPQPGEWLAEHFEEGQSFPQYLKCKPVLPRGKRNILYIQPLGDFTEKQRKIIDLTADFLGRYFQIQTRIADDLPLAIIPRDAQRVHPSWGDKQILSHHVLDQVLRPRLPKDAAAYIAFTSSDLWPGENWNFVFGQASLIHRVGVWSIYRNGDPEKDEAGFKLCLLRTLKTASHETGHMFSIKHCTHYACNMNGSNSRDESDRQPLEVCPECVSKILWAAQADPLKRLQALASFCKENGLADEHSKYEAQIKALSE